MWGIKITSANWQIKWLSWFKKQLRILRRKYKHKDNSGLTIIELLIVLAIVAMIMVIVLLVVPALQRNSRNHQRKQDASRVATAINDYRSILYAGLPNSCNNTQSNCFLRNVPLTMYDNQSTSQNNVSFWNRSMIGPFNDGVDQQLNPSGANALSRLQARSFTKCTTDGQLTGIGAAKNDIALQFAIESPAGNILFCLEF